MLQLPLLRIGQRGAHRLFGAFLRFITRAVPDYLHGEVDDLLVGGGRVHCLTPVSGTFDRTRVAGKGNGGRRPSAIYHKMNDCRWYAADQKAKYDDDDR